MKLTWFGGTTLRVYVGGEIVGIDADLAPSSVSRQELTSGADHLVTLKGAYPTIDPERWAVPRPSRGLDGPAPLRVLSIGPDTCLLSAEGDPPLLVLNVTELPRLGHWVDGAVIVVFGEQGANLAEDIVELDLAHPRHLLLGAAEETVERLVDRLEALDERGEIGFSSLEPGLAVEV